jgi:Peroxiredoxin
MGLAAISYDPMRTLAEFSARRGITFPLLSDPGSETIKRYGILNTTIDPKNELYGYPFPGTFIVDRRGIVTSRVFEPMYQERSTIASLLVRLGRNVDAPATRVTGPHLELTSYATDQVATFGTHFSLVLDVRPWTEGPCLRARGIGLPGGSPRGHGAAGRRVTGGAAPQVR